MSAHKHNPQQNPNNPPTNRAADVTRACLLPPDHPRAAAALAAATAAATTAATAAGGGGDDDIGNGGTSSSDKGGAGEGGGPGPSVSVWDPLFEVSPFFTRFSNFIQVKKMCVYVVDVCVKWVWSGCIVYIKRPGRCRCSTQPAPPNRPTNQPPTTPQKQQKVDIWAATPDDFGRWFGWVESRLRLLILALEQPPLLHSYPLADFLPNPPVPPPPPPPTSTSGAEQQHGQGDWGSGNDNGRGGLKGRVSFFVALCFDSGVLNYDVSSAVQDFLLKVRGCGVVFWGPR